jgi:CheY-like chemotaxis protein
VRILLTGNFDFAEFACAIDDMTDSAEVVRLAGLQAAADWLANGEASVNLIVVAQARPGRFSITEIDALRRSAPLTPIVALLGSWCEGEMRSGSPWPGVTRVYWHQWRERFRQEFANLSRGQPSAWTQPLTATAEERLLSVKSERRHIKGVVAVISDDFEMVDWLAGACADRGMSVIKLQRIPASQIDGIAVVLWDVGLTSPALLDELRIAALRFAKPRIIVLADFPRPDDIEQLLAAGAAAVLSKPLMLNDLDACLDRLVAVN